MGKIVDDLYQAVKAREEFEEFKELKEKCLSVFSNKCGITMDFIEETIKNEWKEIYRKVHIPYELDIKIYYYDLKEGHINRREFKEKQNEAINKIEEKYEILEEKMKKAEAQFSKDYEEFFCKDLSKKKGADKYIYFVMSQPEVKKIIKNFFKI